MSQYDLFKKLKYDHHILDRIDKYELEQLNGNYTSAKRDYLINIILDFIQPRFQNIRINPYASAYIGVSSNPDNRMIWHWANYIKYKDENYEKITRNLCYGNHNDKKLKVPTDYAVIYKTGSKSDVLKMESKLIDHFVDNYPPSLIKNDKKGKYKAGNMNQSPYYLYVYVEKPIK